MDEQMKKLKTRYKAIEDQLVELYAEQERVRVEIQSICKHETYTKVYSSHMEEEYGEESETKYKCQVCYQYFTKAEIMADSYDPMMRRSKDAVDPYETNQSTNNNEE